MAILFPKGELLHPYSVEILEKTVAASNGVMKPGCKFRVTMHSTEVPNMWSLPIVFRGSYVTVDGGQKLRYWVYPGWLVWLLMLLPFAAVSAVVALELNADITTPLGLLIAAVVFLFGFQREKAIVRFQKRFGK